MQNSLDHIPFITSKDNDFYKKVKSYALPKNRKHDGVVLVEGKKLYKEAAAHLNLRNTLVNEDFDPAFFEDISYRQHVLPAEQQHTLSEQDTAHIHPVFSEQHDPTMTLTRLSNHLFTAISDTKSSQGIIGIFDLPQFELELELAQHSRVVVLEGIQDPGNVGTIIRTSLFLGYGAVLLDEACATPFSPKVVRSSMGAVLHIPCITAPLEEHLAQLKQADFCLVGGDLQGEDLQADTEAALQPKLALLFGSEGQGLSEAALLQCNYRFKICAEDPAAESLNVAVASGIMMYQLKNSPAD